LLVKNYLAAVLPIYVQRSYNIIPFLTYYLSTFFAAYDEFEKRANIIQKPRGTKTEMVINAIENFKGDFTISDVEKACRL